jgi:hypothetical protein
MSPNSTEKSFVNFHQTCKRQNSTNFATNQRSIVKRKMLAANKCNNKLQKHHRWKSGEFGSRTDESFHKNNLLLHQSCPVETDSENLRQLKPCSGFSVPQKRANTFAISMMTARSARKLLPIFILVNMLPFLYAGEFFCFYLA